MIESRCGLICSTCEFRETMNCDCITKDKPFWADFCPVKNCCEGRRHEHCGQCEDFPCKILIQIAYDEEVGDNGKCIEMCRIWATGFDAKKFISAVAIQDAHALQTYFAPNAVICRHCSNEQFTVAEYIRANCEYPGSWNGEIRRVDKTHDGVVIVAKIFSADMAVFVTSFATLEEGKITRLDEYYSICEEIPQWRQNMKIGKPIQNERIDSNE